MKPGQKILLIIAHPNIDKSFNHRLAGAAEKQLKEKGHEVRVVDLYKIKFNPVGGPWDFKELQNTESFDYQVNYFKQLLFNKSEQKYANETKKGEAFSDDIKEQMEHVKWADILFFQFPFYWFSMPAILKGWIDRVFSYYFAYGGDCGFAGKKWLTSVTTGAPKDMLSESGFFGTTAEGFLKHFNEMTAKFTKHETLPIYVAHGINFSTPEQKDAIVIDFLEHLKKIF